MSNKIKWYEDAEQVRGLVCNLNIDEFEKLVELVYMARPDELVAAVERIQNVYDPH